MRVNEKLLWNSCSLVEMFFSRKYPFSFMFVAFPYPVRIHYRVAKQKCTELDLAD